MIWKREITIEKLNNRWCESLNSLLDIKFIEFGPDYIVASMPVDERTIQPYGMLHGGASVVLAETIGSVASLYCIPQDENKIPVGIEINASHVKSVMKGDVVIATARPFRLGKSLHIWNIEIKNTNGEIICVSRLTTMIINKRYK